MFNFDIADLQVQTFLLRMLHSLVVLFVCIEMFRSAGFIDNTRVMKIVWRVAWWLLIYFVARIISGILDSWLGFSIGWFSNIVQLGFWIVLYLKARSGRVVLGSSRNTEQRIVLRQAFDDLLDQMETAKQNSQRVLERSKG